MLAFMRARLAAAFTTSYGVVGQELGVFVLCQKGT